MSRLDFYGADKSSRAVMAKEALILTGREAGASTTDLSVITGLDTSSVSRRYDFASQKAQRNRKLAFAKELVAGKYYETVEESNA